LHSGSTKVILLILASLQTLREFLLSSLESLLLCSGHGIQGRNGERVPFISYTPIPVGGAE
jgi:hypothetical protein